MVCSEKKGAHRALLREVSEVELFDLYVERGGGVRDRRNRRLDKREALRTRASYAEGGDAGKGKELAEELHADRDGVGGGRQAE